MLGVLEPFEVRDSDSTGVGNVIWNNWDILLIDDLLSLETDWSIGTFTHDLAFQFAAIVNSEAPFNSAWQEDIAFLVADIHGFIALGHFSAVLVAFP